MKRIVIDTNILVSAALSPKGKPAQIMILISLNELQLFYCSKIIDEYKKVLAYEKLKIPFQAQKNAIEGINKLGISIEPKASIIPFPDEADRIFYDVARASGAILITGNIKHFPVESFIMTPSDFMALLEIEKTPWRLMNRKIKCNSYHQSLTKILQEEDDFHE